MKGASNQTRATLTSFGRVQQQMGVAEPFVWGRGAPDDPNLRPGGHIWDPSGPPDAGGVGLSTSLKILQALGADGIFTDADGIFAAASLLNQGSRHVDGSIQPSPLIAGLYAEPVCAFEARGPVDPGALARAEAEYVARAVPKRAGEFAAGRACARRALAGLGITEFALRVGADREPLWPAGVTGSITHTAGFCGVVAARTAVVASLGLDAERRDAVHRRLWRRIATPEELAWLESLAPDLAPDMAALIFSAKEAFYKCQFPLTREWLDFSAVSVSVGPGSFEVRPRRALALESLARPPWRGRHALDRSLILTGCSLPRRL